MSTGSGRWEARCEKCRLDFAVRGSAPPGRCPHCGAEILGFDCATCGKCISLAHLVTGYCPHCGTRVELMPAPPPPAPEPESQAPAGEADWPPPGYWHEMPATARPSDDFASRPISLGRPASPRSTPPPSRQPLHPTLVIGCGGWGLEVLDALLPVLPVCPAASPPLVRWLGLDSQLETSLERGDFVHLGLTGTTLRRLTANLAAEWPEVAAWFPRPDEFLPLLPGDDLREGTAGCRPLGRLLFHRCVETVLQALSVRMDLLLRDRIELAAPGGRPVAGGMQLPPVDAFIVASLAGGTGGALALDLAALIKAKFGPAGARVHAVFRSGEPPEAGPPTATADRALANTYAALKELEHHMAVGRRLRIDFGPALRIDAAAPFDMVYLVESGHRGPAPPDSSREMARKVADFLVARSFTRLGEAIDAATLDRHAAGATRHVEPGAERSWASSIGASSMLPAPQSCVEREVARCVSRKLDTWLGPLRGWEQDWGLDVTALGFAELAKSGHLGRLADRARAERSSGAAPVFVERTGLVPDALAATLLGDAVPRPPDPPGTAGKSWSAALAGDFLAFRQRLDRSGDGLLEKKLVPQVRERDRSIARTLDELVTRLCDDPSAGPAPAYAELARLAVSINELRNEALRAARGREARARSLLAGATGASSGLARLASGSRRRPPPDLPPPRKLAESMLAWHALHIRCLVDQAVVRVLGATLDAVAGRMARVAGCARRLGAIRSSLEATLAEPGESGTGGGAYGPGDCPPQESVERAAAAILGRPSSWLERSASDPGSLLANRLREALDDLRSATGPAEPPRGAAERRRIVEAAAATLEQRSAPCWRYQLPAGEPLPPTACVWMGERSWLIEELARRTISGSSHVVTDLVVAPGRIDAVRAELAVHLRWLESTGPLFEAYGRVLETSVWPVHVLPGALDFADPSGRPFQSALVQLAELGRRLRDPVTGRPILGDHEGRTVFTLIDAATGARREVALPAELRALSRCLARDGSLARQIEERVLGALRILGPEQRRRIRVSDVPLALRRELVRSLGAAR